MDICTGPSSYPVWFFVRENLPILWIYLQDDVNSLIGNITILTQPMQEETCSFN